MISRIIKVEVRYLDLTVLFLVHFQFMGDFVNAIRDYQAAVKTDPSYSLAYYNAANVYFRQRQFKQVSWVRVLNIKRLSPWLTLRDLELS